MEKRQPVELGAPLSSARRAIRSEGGSSLLTADLSAVRGLRLRVVRHESRSTASVSVPEVVGVEPRAAVSQRTRV